MNKNIYSLVLSEDVVAAVDRLAYSMHTNRSNMVNQILAEYVSYVTPEKRMQQIFERLDDILSGGNIFQALTQPSASVFQLRSSLAYKYNPTVKYNVEIYRQAGRSVGELKVSLRTQNGTLGLYLIQFFKLWSKIEHSYRISAESSVEDGKFVKKLIIDSDIPDADTLAEAIYDYINVFDKAMKTFFYRIEEPAAASAEVENIYKNYIMSSKLPL